MIMKKFVLVAAVGLAAAVVNAGVWMPVPGNAGNPTDIHYVHEGVVQVVPARPCRPHYHCDGGLLGAVFGAVFGHRHYRDYPSTIVVEHPVVVTQSAPPTQVVQVAEPTPPPIQTPTYVKHTTPGHYIDTYDEWGRKIRLWQPPKEEWVRIK